MVKTRTHNRHGVPIEKAEWLCAMRAFERVWRTLKRTRGWIHHPSIWRFDSEYTAGNPIKPNRMTRDEFMWLVASRIQGKWMSDTLIGLLAAIPENPGVLPIIADCIEEAGGDDGDFLFVLRAAT